MNDQKRAGVLAVELMGWHIDNEMYCSYEESEVVGASQARVPMCHVDAWQPWEDMNQAMMLVEEVYMELHCYPSKTYFARFTGSRTGQEGDTPARAVFEAVWQKKKS